MWRSRLGLALVVGGVANCSQCIPPPVSTGGGKPALVVRAPAEFAYNKYTSPILRVLVDGEDLDLRATAPVTVRLLDEKGAPVEAHTSGPLSFAAVALGEGVVAIGVAAAQPPSGRYQVCAAADGVDRGCAPIAITALPLTACQIAFEQKKRDTPAFGCRCTSVTIKRTAADSPDGTLGTFLTPAPSDNHLGPFDDGNLNTTATFSSIYKFEPHFTVVIANDPGPPIDCGPEWDLMTAFLCKEGQELNETITLLAGTPGEVKLPAKQTLFRDHPDAGFDDDDYEGPAPSGQPTLLDGAAKTHDPPGIVHWLDAPGLYQRDSAKFRAVIPSRADHYFHTYVHGSTGDPADDCDCFFTVTSAVLNANGSVGPSTMSRPRCNK